MAKAKAKAKGKRRIASSRPASWVACGFDTSYYTISGAAYAYDATFKQMIGPVAISRRWTKEDDYFSRMRDAAKAHELVLDMIAELNVIVETSDIYIVIEEPVGYSHLKKNLGGVIKQQIQISGAAMGSFLRWGWNNLWEIPANSWRKMVADELGITIHPPKWNDRDLEPPSFEVKCAPKDFGKFRAKQWGIDVMGYEFNWPDIYSSNKLGMVPKPENSIAKCAQSDDRWEAIAMAKLQADELRLLFDK